MKIARKWDTVLKNIAGDLTPETPADIKQMDALKRTFLRNAYRTFLPPELDIAIAALHAAGGGRPLNAIQAGANDGIDPVCKLFRKYFSKIVLVEPQEQLIRKLRENYADYAGELIIENMAIGDDGGSLVLHIPDAELEELYIRKVGRSSSFVVGTDRALTLRIMQVRCGITAEQAEAQVVATAIPAMSISALAQRHGMERVDFLQVDCEGYDWRVIQSMQDLRPSIINFESKLLSKADWAAWVAFARSNDYGFVVCNSDTIAIRHAKLEYAS